MGLIKNIERWKMSSAVSMATETFCTANHPSLPALSFPTYSLQDMVQEAGLTKEAQTVMSALGRMAEESSVLSDWCLYAYAFPQWGRDEVKRRLYKSVLNEWQLTQGEQIEPEILNGVRALIPMVAEQLAVELNQKGINATCGELHGRMTMTRAYLINILLSQYDENCEQPGERFSEEAKAALKAQYLQHWSEWEARIESVRALMLEFDSQAGQMFCSELEQTESTNRFVAV